MFESVSALPADVVVSLVHLQHPPKLLVVPCLVQREPPLSVLGETGALPYP